MSTITVHAPDLDRALRLVKHTAADESDRPILNTILLEGDENGFRLVAADNYRIGIANVAASGDVDSFGRIPLPLSEVPVVLALVAGWKESVTIAGDGEHLTFTTKTRSATVRIMQGTFPTYKPVIDGERSDLGLNPVFLADLGRATKSAASRIRIGAPTAAIEVVVEEMEYREFIMPMRLEPTR